MGFRSCHVAAAAALSLAVMFADGAAAPARADAGCLPASIKGTLARIRQQFGPIQVISTGRPGARTPNGKASYHASCRAVDFNPPRGKHAAVIAWLKANHSGGLGTYSCGMHHIHIDNGPRYQWHTCSGSRTAKKTPTSRSLVAYGLNPTER